MPKELQGLVHGYTRVSDPNQMTDSEASSLDRQTDQVAHKAHGLVAELPSLTVGRLFREEAVSAWKHPICERQQGRKLNETLVNGDHVVFPTLDRGWRKIGDCVSTIEMWWDRGITVHVLNLPMDLSHTMGRGMLHFAALMAEMESGIRSDRVKARWSYNLLNNMDMPKRPAYGKRWVRTRNGQKRSVDDPVGIELFQCLRIWRKEENISPRIARLRTVKFIRWWYRNNSPRDTDEMADALKYHANRDRLRRTLESIDRLEELVSLGAQCNATYLRVRHPQARLFQPRHLSQRRRKVRGQSKPKAPYAPKSIWGVPCNDSG